MIVKINKLHGYILGFVVLLMVIVGFTPMLKTGVMLLLTAMISYAVLVLNSGSRKNNALIVNVIFYISMCFLYKILNISTAGWGYIFIHALFFSPILLMPFATVSLSKKQKKRLLLLIVIIVMVNIIDNIRLVLANPELLVRVNRDFFVEDMKGIGNIGGSQWYNAVFFFFIASLFCYLNCEDNIIKYATLLSATLSGVFIVVFCLKVSVIVFTFFSAVLLVCAKKIQHFTKFVRIAVVAAVFLLLFFNLFADLLTDFLLNTVNKRVASRLIMLIDSDSMEAGSGVSTMNARENLWFVSIKSWLSNILTFFFGIGDHRASENISSVAKTGIGNHSALFDTLGRYGLLGGMLIFNIFRLSFKYILSLFGKNCKLQIVVVCLILLLYGFTKGIFLLGVGCAIFLMLPLMSVFSYER